MSELERRIFGGCGPEWDEESRGRIMAILGEPARGLPPAWYAIARPQLSCHAAALGYIARGWRVLPCHSIRAGACTCGSAECSSPGKHPLTAHGLKDASAEAWDVDLWWGRWPWANVAVATGAESGLVVLDVDTKKRGDLALLALVDRDGPFAYVAHAITGSGGAHYFLRHPGGDVPSGRDSLGIGIDLRADGGYVVAPPSLHASGARYAWAETHITGDPTLPGELAEVNRRDD